MFKIPDVDASLKTSMDGRGDKERVRLFQANKQRESEGLTPNLKQIAWNKQELETAFEKFLQKRLLNIDTRIILRFVSET